MLQYGTNSENKFKLPLLTAIHVLCGLAVFLLAGTRLNPPGNNTISLFLLFLLHLFFALGYFYQLWPALYSNNYLHLLQSNVIRIIIKKLAATTVQILCLFSILFLLFPGNPFQKKPVQILLLLTGQLAFQIVFYLILHLLQLTWAYYLVRLGFLQKNVILLGKPDKRLPVASYFSSLLRTRLCAGTLFRRGKHWYFTPPHRQGQQLKVQNPEEKILKENAGELLIFLGKNFSGEDTYRFVKFCHLNSIEYKLIPALDRLPVRDFWSGNFAYIPLLEHYRTKRDSLLYISCKRLLDILLGGVGILLTLPLCLMIALAIKLEDGGPVLHVSKRVGRNGKVINFFKFRSMISGAHALQGELLKYNQRPDGPLFKMSNDPRMTRVGRIIRDASLDEIPQLLNVLRGDISLVGPRPHLVTEVNAYTAHDKLRLECIPGMTCLPQLHDTQRIGFREWIDLDLEYRRSWSLWLDMKIFFRSLRIVLDSLRNRILPHKK